MRNIAILVAVILGLSVGAYFLFIKGSSSPEPKKAQTTPKTVQKPQKAPSVPHYPSKYHPDHYSGPDNQYADEYLDSERMREELRYDREELADYIDDYDRYNHYDYHDQYENIRQEYVNDDYFYDDYYDYMYPQFNDWEWQHWHDIYSDPDVNEYLNDELNARKGEKEGQKHDTETENIPQDRLDALNQLVSTRLGENASGPQKQKMLGRVNEATKHKSVEKIKKINQKLSDPVAQKENNLKKQFMDSKKEEIAKIGPNRERTLDLFQAKKGEQKFYIFGTHEKETFKQALPEPLYKKVLSNDMLITDGSSDEIHDHFASENRPELSFDSKVLENEIANHKGKKTVVVVKAQALFGDEGLLKHLNQSGYTIMRYSPDAELLKFEP